MPTALEKLAKILKLEKEQGCPDRVVIGGMAAYVQNWKLEAQQEARRPEQYLLAEELADLMQRYTDLSTSAERLEQVLYMLDRIVGRQPLPAAYRDRLPDVEGIFADRARLSPPPTSSPPTSSQSSHSEPHQPSRHDTRSPDSDKKPNTLESGNSNRVDRVLAHATTRLARPPRQPYLQISPAQAREFMAKLDGPASQVKGIGANIAEQLGTMGLHTVNNLLHNFPRRYDDYTRLLSIRHLQPETIATVIGTIDDTEVRVGKGGRKDFFMILSDDTGRMAVTFFGQHFLVRTLRRNQQVVLSGKVGSYRGVPQMANPEWELLDSDNLHTVGVVPVYPLTEGVTAKSFRRTMKNVVDQWADQVPEIVPQAVLERTEIADRRWAYRQIHFPESMDHLHHAQRRLLFDQLIIMQLAVLQNRFEWQSVASPVLEVSDEFLEDFTRNVFVFELTNAQRRAIEDIRRDFSRNVPMNRLIQGDVGSGKTAVAITAMCMAVANGRQAALMAPTSILAEQHYRGMMALAERIPGQRPVIALLTSALSKGEREAIYRGMADGSIDIVIGTHAVIQDGAVFKDLAVAIIDEQHRFGVEQRGALRGKGQNPHLLVMTATPIPRTLALTLYADLDLTIIDEKPAGRQPVKTRVLEPHQRESAYRYIENQIEEGRQAFIIHPLVEASEKIEARSAVEAYDELVVIFPRHRICLLHGRMKAEEKERIMGAFANHEYDIMVTTSVAEVGVDVPNASVILIDGANRFGLAQLHQFRGRVGRGEHASYCFLLPDADTVESSQRLKAMEETDDGFKLAELDWQLRGAGDLLGTRQSGGAPFLLAEYLTPDLVTLAQQEARTIYEEDPQLGAEAHQLLKVLIGRQHGSVGDVS